MTLKRLLLGILTLFAIVLMGTSLAESWSKPQIQGRLELRQTDLLLQASVLQPETTPGIEPLLNTLLGENPTKAALQEYAKAWKLANQVSSNPPDTVPSPALIADLALRVGILHVQQKDIPAALSIWQAVSTAKPAPPMVLVNTADALAGLWQEPTKVTNQTESLLQTNLDGWFRNQALARLYQVTQQTDRLAALQTAAQVAAQKTISRLLVLAIIPSLGLVVGGAILLGLVIQLAVKGKESLLAGINVTDWAVPWDWEVVWQVFILGFFWLGQVLVPYLLLPLLSGLLKVNPATFAERDRALWILLNYGFIAAGGLLTLYWSIKPHLPASPPWFRPHWLSPWLLWGVGGYLVATPIVILVSLVNQQLWQGQGGSNPILPIALNSGDPIAIACFFITASLAAPIFEEIMFRGFLLPSLTRYIPAWGAIVLSSLLFALAHLSLSEVLPLTALGCVLGFVYLRSRSLLAPILLHSLWNGGTLVSLLMLGSASNPS